MSGIQTSVAQRLRDKVRIDANGCWLWTGHRRASNGYGRIKVNNRDSTTHRVAYETFVGPIPDGLHIDHLCGVRLCVNPAHLEPVTQQENNRRVVLRAVARAPKAACRHGHAYTPDNTYTAPSGARGCRECRRINARKRWTSRPVYVSP